MDVTMARLCCRMGGPTDSGNTDRRTESLLVESSPFYSLASVVLLLFGTTNEYSRVAVVVGTHKEKRIPSGKTYYSIGE
eukprot:scaffold3987_cov134-Cylindrotheca_fusiformis.AAC.10